MSNISDDRSGNNDGWRSVTPAEPCAHCRKGDWCRRNCESAVCYRPDDAPIGDNGNLATDKNGTRCFKFRVAPRTRRAGDWPEPTCDQKGAALADADTRNAVYSELLKGLSLDAGHRKAIKDRGVDPGKMRQLGYATLDGPRRCDVIQGMIRKAMESLLPGTPGFNVKERNGRRYWSFGGSRCLLIPIRDAQGRIVGISMRPDKPPPGKGKYFWASSKRFGGPGPGSPVHSPIFAGNRTLAYLTEGGLKGDVATLLSGTLTLGLGGVSMYKRAAKIFLELGVTTVRVAFDADWRRNPGVATAIVGAVAHLRSRGFAVELALWDEADGKGIDDLLAKGMTPDVVSGQEAVNVALVEIDKAASAKRCGGETARSSGRVRVDVGPDEHRVVVEAIDALSRHNTDLYQRGSELVRITRDSAIGDQLPLRIRVLPLASLRIDIARYVELIETRLNAEGESVESEVHPSGWLVEGVAAAGNWPGVRHLEAVIEAPALRSDGSVIQAPGYDSATGVFYAPAGEFPVVAENPTRADAIAAAAAIEDVVVDFPFAEPVHRAAWLAGLLTLLSRFAFRGPAPLFLVSANVRGSGKSLLAEIAAIIATGREFPRRSYPRARNAAEEMGKIILALAVGSERQVLLDNLDTALGDASLDAALTTTVWAGRLLGHTRDVSAPLLVTWWATGNNASVAGDTCRRVLPIRLESPDEQPESRTGFRHPDLLGWVRAERGRLLAAALTILSAYCRAGRPRQPIATWGSYEAWSALVRGALVWAGLPDPRGACREFAEDGDGEAAALAGMLDAWSEVDPSGKGLTVADLLKMLRDDNCEPPRYPGAAAALTEFCPSKHGLPTPTALGHRFKRFARRNVGNRMFDSRPGSARRTIWFVRKASAPPPATGEVGEVSEVVSTTLFAAAHTHTHTRANAAAPTSPTSPTSPAEDYGDAYEGPDEFAGTCAPPCSGNAYSEGY